MKTKSAAFIWTKRASVTREGKFFFTASIGGESSPGSVVTVAQSFLSGKWSVQHGSRILPAEWATSSEAKRYAETVFSFGRFA